MKRELRCVTQICQHDMVKTDRVHLMSVTSLFPLNNKISELQTCQTFKYLTRNRIVKSNWD